MGCPPGGPDALQQISDDDDDEDDDNNRNNENEDVVDAEIGYND